MCNQDEDRDFMNYGRSKKEVIKEMRETLDRVLGKEYQDSAGDKNADHLLKTPRFKPEYPGVTRNDKA